MKKRKSYTSNIHLKSQHKRISGWHADQDKKNGKGARIYIVLKLLEDVIRQLLQSDLDALRAPFVSVLGFSTVEAPNSVGLFAFDDGSWVVMNFNDSPVKVRLNGEAHEVAARQWRCHWTGR